ncbi:lamin tail domain-containing protein [Luteimonas chenhongjianii]|uniref:lamin tail domain-containing protein n=1 Tax=Luteimonas chenhongjianii TaxID=2006110 RepID=UPI001C9E1E83|nr:lamin tail domain-containing protein [Luteimonas chenhongjianii]
MNRTTGGLLSALLLCGAAGTAHADIVISQAYGGGGNSGAPLNADFVELFNSGDLPAPLGGKSVQYASATGTGNFGAGAGQIVVLPDVEIPAGGYYLVGLAGGANGGPLPTPDASGTINMSGSAGKVVLADTPTSLGCNGGNNACSPAQQALILDLVGFGNANFFEGSAPAPATSNSTDPARRRWLHRHQRQRRGFRDRCARATQQREHSQRLQWRRHAVHQHRRRQAARRATAARRRSSSPSR